VVYGQSSLVRITTGAQGQQFSDLIDNFPVDLLSQCSPKSGFPAFRGFFWYFPAVAVILKRLGNILAV
jgi:hypothetical protein